MIEQDTTITQVTLFRYSAQKPIWTGVACYLDDKEVWPGEGNFSCVLKSGWEVWANCSSRLQTKSSPVIS